MTDLTPDAPAAQMSQHEQDRERRKASEAHVVEEIAVQRARNHKRWGDKSIENRPPNYEGWLPTLGEEYGEVCRALTLEQGDPVKLREELVDVAAVALMWIDSIDRLPTPKGKSC